ncbi:NADPH-dependent F420 reductase [Methanorbis furvi]|uniref:Pyrroline-5-carboxylate reductase catalytic N-terminal domain-containing protein n=1 Tax=Methanorbis furvi TaxID=3028299 RepID=A0AAE4S9X8_9EURY|nr:hypothetical protein [Methanocorpusculaceae archaeon Ag1]
MKIGIIGGTGDIGKGLALRLSNKHEIILGSREASKACEVAEETVCTLGERNCASLCRGVSNEEAVRDADIVVISVMFQHVAPTLAGINSKYLENKIIISPVNPMGRKDGYFFFNPPAEGSAALAIEKMLPQSAKIVTAFNNIAAHKWTLLDEELDYTVAVCGNDVEAKKTVMKLVSEVSKLHAVDAGPLAVAGIVESLTPLVLNIAQNNGMKDVGVHFS